jgi:hypothetical protein
MKLQAITLALIGILGLLGIVIGLLTKDPRNMSDHDLITKLELARIEGVEVPEIVEALRARGLGVCRVCRCTDVTACDPPCSWLESDLCSACGVAAG